MTATPNFTTTIIFMNVHIYNESNTKVWLNAHIIHMWQRHCCVGTSNIRIVSIVVSLSLCSIRQKCTLSESLVFAGNIYRRSLTIINININVVNKEIFDLKICVVFFHRHFSFLQSKKLTEIK